jgi:hypothetical protein
MKKLFVVLLALTALITPYAEAKTCYGISCNYIDTNSGFDATPNHGQSWSYDAGVTFAATSVCSNNNSYVALLDNTEAIWRFPFIDDSYSSYKLSFKAYLPGDTNNFYDELKVSVKNNTTQVTETMYLHGNSFDNCGNTIEWYLSNDYDLTNTTVVFESGTFSSHVWQIEDVGFWAYD